MNKEPPFEWDEAKRISNLTKHNIDFEAIGGAFSDPEALRFADDRKDYDELRTIMVARCGSDTLTIVFAWRGARMRIISARTANPKERRLYEKRLHERR